MLAWTVGIPADATAAPITIDPGAYTGTYYFQGNGGQRRGPTTLDLSPGGHLLIVGPDGAYIPLQVDAAGNVTTTNAGAAITSGGTVTFQTTTVTIDPGGFAGRYFLANDLSAPRVGPNNVTLVKNLLTYVAAGGIGTASDIVFRVEANGELSVVSPTYGATASGGTLAFVTRPVSFDPGIYAGDYFVHFASTALRGQQTVDLPIGIATYVEIGGRGFAPIGFRLDASEIATVISPVSAATGGFRSISFNSQAVDLEPGDYLGSYFVAGWPELTFQGPTTVVQVPGLRSYVEVGGRGVGALIAYQIGPVGLQLITLGPAQVNGFELAFANQAIDIDPGSYAGPYTPLGHAPTSGPSSYTIVPELPMYLRVGPNAGSYVAHAGPSCSVSPSSLPVGSATFDLVCAAGIDDADGDGVDDDADVCPGADDAADYDVDGTPDGCDACPIDFYNDTDGDGSCDSDDICMLDGDNDADGDGACADVDPCPADADNDADGDGVCSDRDACPYDAANDADGDGICGNVDTCLLGDDEADADEDGAADACDVCPSDAANDADGDGTCADLDPCPLDPADDEDADGACAQEDPCPRDPVDDIDSDGVCSDLDPCPLDALNDGDGDGFCELEDNCPALANADQSDVDSDGIGDACEADQDDDGVTDDWDNCALDPNASQSDLDADGLGDVCDADDDADGVADASDVCLSTPPGQPVLSNGCAVAEHCACSSPWKNHGAYVSCVTHSATLLFQAGRMTSSQRSAAVQAAAQSSCGKH